jgi:hypothetical protein
VIGLALMMMRQAEKDAGLGWDGVLQAFGPECRKLALRYTDWPLSRRYYELVDACPLRMQHPQHSEPQS